MDYQERLRHYEQEKQELMSEGVSALEYERRIIELAKKWRV